MLDDIDAYLKDITANTRKATDKEELSDLLISYRKTKCVKTRNLIVEMNLGLVISYANKFKNQGVPLQDLVSEGNIGLIRAIDKFDPSMGNTLSTYAVWWIQERLTYLINHKGLIKIPKLHLVSLRKDYLGSTKGFHDGTAKDDKLNLNQKRKIEELPVFSESINHSSDSLTSHVESLDDPLESLLQSDQVSSLNSFLSLLSEKEANILRFRFGIGTTPLSSASISRVTGVAKHSVYGFEQQALKKLREILSGQKAAYAF